MAVIDSAVALYQAKNYSGSGEWLDESGNSHDLQFGSTSGADTNDPSFNADPPYFSFGTDDYFLFDNTSGWLDFAAADSFTVIAVVAPTDAYDSTRNQYVVATKVTYDSTSGFNLHLDWISGKTGWFISDGTAKYECYSTGATADGETSVIAGRRDFTADDISGWIEGVEGTPVTDGTTGDLTATYAYIGGGDGSQYFAGKIMAVAIFDTALSDADVATAGDELLATLAVETVVRPIADTAGTGWDTAPTGSQSLYAQVDEETASDTDYIYATDPNP